MAWTVFFTHYYDTGNSSGTSGSWYCLLKEGKWRLEARSDRHAQQFTFSVNRRKGQRRPKIGDDAILPEEIMYRHRAGIQVCAQFIGAGDPFNSTGGKGRAQPIYWVRKVETKCLFKDARAGREPPC